MGQQASLLAQLLPAAECCANDGRKVVQGLLTAAAGTAAALGPMRL